MQSDRVRLTNTDLTLTVENRQKSNGTGTRRVCLAVLTKLSVWYKLVKPDDSEVLCQVDAGGASDNDDEAYAIKGAITYAIGNALSKIGWQKSVYLGKRSHKTVRASAPSKPAPAAKVPAQKPAVVGPKPTARAAPASDGEISDAKPEDGLKAEAMTLDVALKFAVPVGAWKGKTFKQVVAAGESGQKAIDFWSHMNPGVDLGKQTLKAVALRYVELAKANHKVPVGNKVAETA